jgi:hypothetical protein
MSENGRLKASELSDVGGMLLEARAAQAFRNWSAATAAATGRGITIIRPAGAYRSYAVQRDMRLNPGRWNLNPSSSINLAREGSSTHGFGTRVDIGYYTGAGWAWALANAHRFGFRREFGAADPNHFMHDGRTFGPTINPTSTIKPIPLEDEMSAAGEAAIIAQLQNLGATLANVERLLAVDVTGNVPGGIRGRLGAVADGISNLERIVAVDTVNGVPGGLRGRLAGIDAQGKNITNILAVDTVNGIGGGLRGSTQEALKGINAVAAAIK